MITISSRPSRAHYRAVDYVVAVDGTTIFTTASRLEAEFIAERARIEAVAR